MFIGVPIHIINNGVLKVGYMGARTMELLAENGGQIGNAAVEQ